MELSAYYRQLNDRMLLYRYAVPHLHDFSNHIHDIKIYPVISIDRTFIHVAPEDITKTAIITLFGLFEFQRMTFRLRNATRNLNFNREQQHYNGQRADSRDTTRQHQQPNTTSTTKQDK